MKFLKLTTIWSNMEIGFLKMCVLSSGIFIGSSFHENVAKIEILFLGFAVLSGIWLFALWLKKMKEANSLNSTPHEYVQPK